MKILCMGVVLLFSTLKTIGQWRYLQLIKKADSLLVASNFTGAAEFYEKAFKTRKPDLIDFVYCARSYAEAGNTGKAFNMLQKAADNGFIEYDKLLTDSGFRKIHKDTRWIAVINKVNDNYAEKMKINGIDLVKELNYIYETDQLHRLKLDSLYKSGSKDQKLMSLLSDSVMHYDTINLDRIIKIIDKFGWPGIDDVGSKGNLTVFLVIQHADSATQKKYLPLLKRSIKNHQSSPDFYGYLLDRIMTSEGKKQIYGTQLTLDEKTNKYILLPVKHPGRINKRRKKLGLSTIEQYLKENN
ncbi:DUF6624 domain-containing protein [Niastella sp. OAS944]|uniref:DUF6624 domain-containing protein n=1 Tax=Niastella sp. OAS944 TaxID=2664089 RepID=UPI00347E894F|nr:hypothetical protein [Chitinophagaceae bacterium OAS944]